MRASVLRAVREVAPAPGNGRGQLRCGATLSFVLIFCNSGCGFAASQSGRAVATATPRATTAQASGRRVGVQCTPYLSDKPSGPISYTAARVGTKGVPPVGGPDRQTLALIRRFVHSRTLRFVYLRDRGFIVFDARYGPCNGAAPGYPVLNGACNEYYEPGEDPTKTHPMSGCVGPPRPWVPSDAGLPGNPNDWAGTK